MKVLVVHDEKGHIHSIALAKPGIGKIGLHPPAGRQVSEVEVGGLSANVASLENHVRLRELARSHIVQKDRRTLVKRS